jgi:hypothetical protein
VRVDEVVAGYLSIVADLDRLLPGLLDVPGVRPAGQRASAPELVRSAGRLARAVSDVVEPGRGDFLRGQLRACEWTARRLAGQSVRYGLEVRAAYGVRIEPGSPERYRAAHRELDELLPGPGRLTDRLAAHRHREAIPRIRLADAVRMLSDALRARTRAVVGLPARERVVLRLVDDAPWAALHHYRGGYASTVTFNSGARLRWSQLAQLVAHEMYPGHHTERCRKESGLVTAGWDEHSAVVANTPQSLVAEGAADVGLDVVVGPGWGPWAAQVLGDLAPNFDGELAERVHAATSVLARVRQDAALLLHAHGVADREVLTYLRRWLLVGDARAAAVLRFLRHRLWRTYTSTYVEGRALARNWIGSAQPGERLRRLLDEPLTPWALQAGDG